MKRFLLLLLPPLNVLNLHSQEVQDSISPETINIVTSNIDNNILMGVFFTLPFLLLVCHIIGISFSNKKMHYILWGVFLVLCGFECLLLTSLEPLFSDYINNLEGWGAFRFLLLVGFTGVMQVLSFFKIMDNIQYYHGEFSLTIGFIAFGIGVILSILLGLIWGELPFGISLLLTILTQPAQAIYIFIMLVKKSNIFIATLAAITYLIGFTLTLAALLIYLIFSTLLKIIFWFFSRSSKDSDDDGEKRTRDYENALWHTYYRRY